MNNKRGTFILCVAIGAILLQGCAGVVIKPVCRHKAMYCGLAAQEQGYESRVDFGPITPQEQVVWHAQAKSMIDGAWRWLRMGPGGDCYPGSMDDFQPLNSLPVKDYIRRFVIRP
jgi:hypothetical protein